MAVATTPPAGYYAYRTGRITSSVDVTLDIVLPQRYELAPQCEFAAYGGSFAEALTQVSNDFDRTVESIRKSLEALAKT